MKKDPLRILAISTVVAALLLTANLSSATIWNLEAYLGGLQEVPPVATPGTGYATVTLDDVSGAVTLIGTFSGLLSPAINAHIHGFAPVGVNAGVQLQLTFDPATSGNLSGNGIFNATQVANMLAGLTYVNVHSSQLPGGEIRGQILVVPEPATAALLILAGVGLLGRYRLPTRK